MTSRVHQLFGLRSGETGLVLILGFLLFSNSLALAVSNVVSVSGFLSTVGVNEILIVWIVDMLLVVLATGLQSLIVDRFDRVTLLGGMSLIFALIYMALRLMFVLNVPGWLNYSLLFLLTDQQWLFFPLVFWILANDLLDMAQTKRLFPLIVSGGLIGQIAGLGLTAAAPNLVKRLGVSSAELLTLNVAIYALALLVILRFLLPYRSKMPQRQRQEQTVRATLTEGWAFVREVPSFRYLMLAMLAMSIAFTIIEFHFLAVAYSDTGNFQTFYSLYNLGATIAVTVIQGLFMARIISRFQIKSIFLILPFTLLIGSLWMIALPGIISVVFGVVLPRLARQTVDQSARKSFQALVPEERRGRVSMFMDSYLFAGGSIIGSVVTGAVVLLGEQWHEITLSTIYLPIAVITTLIAIRFTFKMRAVYDASLLNWRLKRRQRGANVLDKLNF